MGKFVKKVGQKYRVLEDWTMTCEKDEIVVLIEVHTDKISRYKTEDGKKVYLHDIDHQKCEVELVDEVSTKDDLKVGYMVELRSGDLGHVIPSLKHDLVLNFENIGVQLDIYNDNLTHKNKDIYDIVKVYGLTNRGFNAHKFITKYRELLWEREEVKEMTLEQIEKELGYKIKLIEKENE